MILFIYFNNFRKYEAGWKNNLWMVTLYLSPAPKQFPNTAEHFTPRSCTFTSGRTIRTSLKASPDTIPPATLPSVLHKSHHALLVISTWARWWLNRGLEIWREGVRLQSSQVSAHCGGTVADADRRFTANDAWIHEGVVLKEKHRQKG